MREPVFLFLGIGFSSAFVFAGLTSYRFRIGKLADDPATYGLRRRIGIRMAWIGGSFFLGLGVIGAFFG